MGPPLFLLKAVGKLALVLLGGGVVVEILRELPDLVADAWRWWKGERGERRRHEEPPAERPGARLRKGRSRGPAQPAPVSGRAWGRPEGNGEGVSAAEWVAVVLGAAAGAVLAVILALLWLAGGSPRLPREKGGNPAGSEITNAKVHPTAPARKEEVAQLPKEKIAPPPVAGGPPPPDDAKPPPRDLPAEEAPALIEDVPPKPPPDEAAELPPLKLNDPPQVKPPSTETYAAEEAWRAGAKLLARRVRLTGRAEVKPGLSGRSVVWFISSKGRRLVVASLKDAGKLKGGVVRAEDVLWGLTVEGTVSRSGSGTMTLSDAEVLKADVADDQG